MKVRERRGVTCERNGGTHHHLVRHANAYHFTVPHHNPGNGFRRWRGRSEKLYAGFRVPKMRDLRTVLYLLDVYICRRSLYFLPVHFLPRHIEGHGRIEGIRPERFDHDNGNYLRDEFRRHI